METIYLDLLIDFKHEIETDNHINKKLLKKFFLFYVTILELSINGNGSEIEKLAFFLAKIDILSKIENEKKLLEIFIRLKF